jgi:perosamine synthetase
MIPVNEPLLNGNEKKYLDQCIDTGWISSEGPFVHQFESQFASFVGRKFGISVCNGSVALDVALQALDLPKNSEVILPSFTIISCAAAVIRAGLVPVVVDADPTTWNMTAALVREKVSNKTSAIMVVHIYGLPVDMDPIFEIAEKHGLKIIEDGAEQIGQTYKGRPVGSLGHISTFSFYPNKHITTGEGGMVVVDDKDVAEKCRSLRNLCFIPEKRFVHYELGYNFRMTNLQAALGIAQLERVTDFLTKKREIGRRYHKALAKVEYLELLPETTSYAENIHWVFGVVLKDHFPHNAEWFMKKLSELKIGTRPFFYPMHKQPVFNSMGLFLNESLPVSERLAERGFYVPSGLALTEPQIQTVIDAVCGIFQQFERTR